MAEYIEKQEAIDMLRDYFSYEENGEVELGAYWYHTSVEQCIKEMTPADVQPVVRGQWVRINEYDKESNVKCSICNKEFPYIDGVCYLVSGSELPHFCPNCGAWICEVNK